MSCDILWTTARALKLGMCLSLQSYDSTKQLRYGHLMIMTDQDHDGSHIKGLIMNFLHHFYPSLLKIKGFLLEFITPIVKVSCSAAGKAAALFWESNDPIFSAAARKTIGKAAMCQDLHMSK
jgi:DNA gyrase/topoisomerase IV subunit B